MDTQKICATSLLNYENIFTKNKKCEKKSYYKKLSEAEKN